MNMRSITDLKKSAKSIDQEQLFLMIKEQVEIGEHETLLAALNEYCEENDIDYDKIGKYLHPSLKSLLYNEAMKNGLLSRDALQESQLSDDFFEEE